MKKRPGLILLLELMFSVSMDMQMTITKCLFIMPISIEEGEKNSDLQSTYIDGSALCEGFEKNSGMQLH